MNFAGLGLPLHRNLPRRIIIVKPPTKAEATAPETILDPGYLTYALDSQLAAWLLRGREQNLDPNVRPDRWAFAAIDEGSAHRKIPGEPDIGVLRLITPVEDGGQAKFVTHSRSALRSV
jgi:hypothetical protein